MSEDLPAELAAYTRQAEVQSEEVAALGARLTQAQLDWRPRADKWSMGEHLSHLALSNPPYLESIEAALASAREAGLTGPGPYRHGWLGNAFARSMEPPPRLRFKTFRSLEPPALRPLGEVLSAFAAVQDRLIRALRDANGVDLGRARMRSPFLKLLRLTVGQAFRVVLAHNRRHLWHVRQIESSPGFPSP